jgi:hypothetical protein
MMKLRFRDMYAALAIVRQVLRRNSGERLS